MAPPREISVDEPLLGNHQVRARLARAMAEDRLHHCYLFEGPEGVGKAQVAMRFALALNCEAYDDAGPGLFGRPAPPPPRPVGDLSFCGTCRACRMILSGNHPDVLWVGVDPEKATPIISSAQAREILAMLLLQRHSAKRRVVVLDPADALNEEAGNALLKTLEEPPSGTQFVLVSARPASLLQTVRSRSQRVRFGPVRADELRPWLVGRGIDPGLTEASLGSPGLALRLAEGEAAVRAEVADALLAVVGEALPRVFAFTESTAKKAESGSERAELVLQVLEELLRDATLCASDRRGRVLHTSHLPQLERWAAAMWPNGLGRLERAVAVARDRLRLNVNGRVVLEALLSAMNLELSQARG